MSLALEALSPRRHRRADREKNDERRRTADNWSRHRADEGNHTVRVGLAAAPTRERDELVIENIALVKSLARRLFQRLPSQVSLEDLISAGLLGLMEAANRYQPSLGVPFEAYARRRIHGAMLDALRALDWAPRSLRRLRRDVDSAIATVRSRTGEEPDEQAIAVELGIPQRRYEETMERLRTLESGAAREVEAHAADGTPLIELCADPGESAFETIERSQLRRHLAAAIEQLPERERQILALYYEEEMTLAEIGETIGVCESRVCQLRGVAESRLRTLLRASLALPGGPGRPSPGPR
jgi:RNA polymerase sigma factor for flagellar operon FliA